MLNHKSHQIGFSVLAVLGTAVSAVLAADFPDKAFDATYEMGGPLGNSTMRLLSDGQGHTRQEVTAANSGYKVVTITDYPKKTAVNLMVEQKMAIRMPFKPSTTHEVMDEATAKEHGATALGVKIIDGHPCHGWQYSTGNQLNEVWSGDDIGNVVYSVQKSPQGQITMKLNKYSSNAPAAEVFSVPSDFQFIQVPEAFPQGKDQSIKLK